MAVLRSAVIWIAVVVVTLAFFCATVPTALLLLPVDRRKNTSHAFGRFWARSIFAINPRNVVRVEGAENLTKIGGNGAAVLCCNHQSMADIVALYYLGHPFKWISKQEVFYVPLIGTAMWLAGYIPLKRGDKESIRRCMARAHGWLLAGVSIMMFPEGTRSLDGRLKSFKEGAFRMAVDTGVPVVPIAIHGPREMLEKGSWKFAPRCTISIVVGPPLRPNADSRAESDRLREETRRWILNALAVLRDVEPAALDARAA